MIGNRLLVKSNQTIEPIGRYVEETIPKQQLPRIYLYMKMKTRSSTRSCLLLTVWYPSQVLRPLLVTVKAGSHALFYVYYALSKDWKLLIFRGHQYINWNITWSVLEPGDLFTLYQAWAFLASWRWPPLVKTFSSLCPLYGTRNPPAVSIWWAKELLGCLITNRCFKSAITISTLNVSIERFYLHCDILITSCLQCLTKFRIPFPAVQKISPDTKEKVQLQLVMHNGEANTFLFRNPANRNAQVADREKVKELLQKLLPQFRSKINSELEMKHKFVDPHVYVIVLSHVYVIVLSP